MFSLGFVNGTKEAFAKDVEAKAILSDIFVAGWQGLSLVHVASNSLKEIQALNGGQNWTLNRIVHDCASRSYDLLLGELRFDAP
ncbi:hypothetical protein MRB53_016143 [Persea americana]|uniref:Uncharacterized protein n=1 Tax=Persea americana TaxID=3435 RepID=A0ACC2M2B2_PERAE|nr:hypothetical protein MRB53_016143 [Persea americana]